MKMCGINVISTYIFWIHHEEEEGVFDFSGRKNLRKFIELCQKHHIYVILRIGPFDHGEVRNGGLPDWLYGKSFEVRKLNDGFLYYVKRLYTEIAGQVQGLLYKDGEAYMYALRDLAKECGIVTPFYTCTGWGGAITPDEMLPLWGGYAYRPWLFYTARGEHPATEEYIYQNYHNNDAVVTSDFRPAYSPEERPYACCEMGGGMTCTYNYRFILPYKSIDAMANIKLASGCNFLGYYMFQGGSNPKGKHGTFMNEAQSPKISYDYQAALGEFGQIRESYQRLKSVHSFCRTFAETFCHMQTVLPKGASQIDPSDADTLRFAVRTDGHSGYLFLNNFQDHMETRAKENETVILHITGEDITFSGISLAPEENCILPFHMDLNGIDLVTATVQPITVLSDQKEPVFIFLKPEGMNPIFHFEDKAVTDQGDHTYQCCTEKEAELFRVTKLLDTDNTIFDLWRADTNARQIPVRITQTARTKYELSFPDRFMNGLKDALLCVDYTGDIGSAFINGDMINDNFCNHSTWEIGLRTFARRLEKHPLTISITPLREGRNVNVESAMAARMENAEKYTAELRNITVKPVYEIYL